jgi:hypothetical protein
LTEEQVRTYLERMGEPLAEVRATLDEDAAFRDLLKTPLLLNIVTLAYRGKRAVALSGTPEQRRQQLFAVYVDEMFKHRDREPRYPKHKTVYWLACLARLLVEQNQTEFYLDRIQRDWLSTQAQQRMVTIVSALFLALLATSLSFGLAIGLVGLKVWACGASTYRG